MATNVSAERRRAVGFVVGSWRCGCGERKRPMRAFCDKCWAKVPSDKKGQLVKMIKGGFVMAFEETRALLGHGPMPEMRPRSEERAKDSITPKENDVNLKIEQIARVCHETNRAYCQSLGDNSQPIWEEAPEWQRNSALDGVAFHFAELRIGIKPDPSKSHNNWLKEKNAAGWKYGPEKNPEAKEHPCFVPYEELPIEQRLKDYIFAAVCEAFYQAEAVPV